MVNYARMETVWRSYGPLEPIGPSVSRSRRRRPGKAAAAGLAAVCVAGAGAGLYLRPELTSPPAQASVPAERGPIVRVSDPEAPSAPTPEEAAQLQSQLQMLVLGGVAPSAAADTSPTPLGAPVADGSTGARPPVGATAAPRSAPRLLASRTPPPLVLSPPPRRAAEPAPARAPAAAPRSSPARPGPSEAPAPVAAAPEPEAAAGPTYDCGGARTAAERIVCASPELAALDRNMAAELDAAVAAGHNPRELARDQADWRRRRDKAAPDPRAVADMYRRRIGQLRSMQ